MSDNVEIEPDRTEIEPGVGVDGNTKKRQPPQLAMHFFTWNNYPDNWQSYFLELDDWFQQYAMQQEIGESGTKHIQGCIRCIKRRRRTEFNLPQQIHWEGVKDWHSSLRYCTDPTKRDPNGTVLTKNYVAPERIRCINPTYEWEQEILQIIKNPPDERTIHWYWSDAGKMGKTQFAKYLSIYHGAIPLDGKKNDMLFCAATHESNIYILLLSRTQEDHVSYDTLEKIKDGYFMCGKYESKPIIRNPPHIFVFANFRPQQSKMSFDRWHIVEIIKN